MNRAGKRYGTAVPQKLPVALGGVLLLCAVQAHGWAQSLPTRHVREEVIDGEAQFLHVLPASKSLHLNIALQLRNESELDDLLERLYDPQSPSFHQFLSVAEYTARFGPTEEDYAATIRFAQANGLQVTGTSPNRLVLDVTGSVAHIDRAFQVSMSVYRHPREARTFYSPDREPIAPAGLPLWHITGLDNFSIPHPASLRNDPSAMRHTTGSGPGGEFIGSDMRAAYYGGTALTGAGQSVGLLEFVGFNIADVNKYFSEVKQKRTVKVVGVSVDGGTASCTKCNDSEQVLDIIEAISMAPGMSQVRVYVAKSSDTDIFNKMATDNLAKQLSCSWGWGPADTTKDDPIFKEFAAQGQTLFAASGDDGAYKTTSRDVYPSDDAYLTSVGGTDLTTGGAGGAWKSETAWRHSGGGISPNKIAIPSYQKAAGVVTAANKGSKTLRNGPDVAAEADEDNYICSNGRCDGGWGGTSFAAPRWAGYLALVNQQAAAKGKSAVGSLNPAIYKIGLDSNYATAFHDITSGTNGTYSAEKGYDLVTGWGSPKGIGLIDILAP